MVTAQRETALYDVFIDHSSSKVGYMLAEESDTGVKSYSPGLAPLFAQQRHTGDRNYSAYRQDIFAELAFENWKEGAGFHEAADDPVEQLQGYSYSQGVDASQRDRLYLSPERQSISGISAAPSQFLRSSIGTAISVGGVVYSLAAGGSATSEVSTGGTVTSLFEFENRVYAMIGDGANYYHSASGNITGTWTQVSSGPTGGGSFMAARGQSSASAIAWRMTAAGALTNSVNPADGGTSWSAATQLGHSSMTFNALINLDDVLYGFADEGIFSYDGTNTSDVFWANTLSHASNGKFAFAWVNKKIYFNFGRGTLMEFDPDSNRRTLRPVWKAQHPELGGVITAIHGDSTHLYFAIKNHAGNTYIMKGEPESTEENATFAFHTWAYLGDNDCNAIQIVRVGVPETANPSALFGYGATAKNFILPREGYRLEDDSNVRYDTGGGNIFGAFLDVGTQEYPKLVNGGRLFCKNLSSARTVQLLFSQDDNTTTASVLTAVDNNLREVAITPVSFHTIRYQMTLATDVNTQSPRVLGATLTATPNPPRKRQWQMVLKVGDDIAPRGGGKPRYGGNFLERHLFRAVGEVTTLTDRRGRTFVVKVEDPTSLGAVARQRGDIEFYQVTMIEVTQTAGFEDVLTWNQDRYNTGKVWGRN